MNKKVMVLGGLVMAVVLTGYSVVGTYAKYTETKSMSDQATVAKWDVTLTANATKPLFNPANNNALVSNRVAPGGSDSAQWTLTGADGKSEVKVLYTVSMTAENTVSLEITEEQYNKLVAAGLTDIVYTEDSKYYYAPVVFDVNGTKSNHLVAEEITVANGQTIDIEWNWAYDVNDYTLTEAEGVDAEEIATLIDTLDTQLGRIADPEQKVQVYASITATQAKLDANKAEVTTPVAADIEGLKNAYNYDPEFTKDVVFAGNKLTGTIKVNNDATLAGIFAADDAKGYYYPVVLKGEEGAEFTIGIHNPKTLKLGADGSSEVLMALDKDADEKVITITMNGTTTTIDYSELNFAE